MSKLPFNHVCIINLKKNKERLKNCLRQLKNENLLGKKCVEAVDGYSYVPYGKYLKKKNTRKKYLPLMRKSMTNKNLTAKSYRTLRIGEIGCLQSFIETFKVLLKSKHKRVLICEDDFKLVPSFREKLLKVSKDIPKDCDVLYLGISKINYKYGKFKKVNNTINKPLGSSLPKNIPDSHGAIYGNHGFIINRKAMKEFIKHSMPMKYAADVLLGKLATKYKLINSYTLKEDLIETYNFGSNTISK